MKSICIILLIVIFSLKAFAQNGQTDEGKFLLEANTGFGSFGSVGVFGFGHPASTSFSLISVDGITLWNIGFEGGYFVKDNFAPKIGLGIGNFDEITVVTYKVGLKYYVIGKIPFQIDFTGQSIEESDEDPTNIGIQGGYAFFIGDKISIEPGLRYNIALNDFYEDVFEAQIGFALFF